MFKANPLSVEANYFSGEGQIKQTVCILDRESSRSREVEDSWDFFSC